MSKKKFLKAVVALATCFAFGSAYADVGSGEVQSTGFTNGFQDDVGITWTWTNSGSRTAIAGPLDIDWGGVFWDSNPALPAGSYVAVSIDPRGTFPVSTLGGSAGESAVYGGYTSQTAGPGFLNQTKINLLSQLYDGYYWTATGSGNAGDAAAFQVAVWEILVDGGVWAWDNAVSNGLPLFGTGDFRVTSTITPEMASLQSAMVGFDPNSSVGDWNFAVLVNQNRQDLLVAIAPVPEPGSWALLLGGLGLIGFMARRRPSSSDHGLIPA